MLRINAIRGGKITVTCNSTTYSYGSLPKNLKFEIVKKLKNSYPGYLLEYRKLLLAGMLGVDAEQLIIKKVIDKIN